MDRYGQMSRWNDKMLLCSVGILLIFSVIPWLVDDDNTKLFSTVIFIYVVVCLITIIALCNTPLDISISKSHLRINFPFRKKMIPMDEVISAGVFGSDESILKKIRYIGYFGWWGKYHDDTMGTIRIYASDLRNLVLVKLKDGCTIVFSCNDAPMMAETINKRRSRSI